MKPSDRGSYTHAIEQLINPSDMPRRIAARHLEEAIDELFSLREFHVEWVCTQCNVVYPRIEPGVRLETCPQCASPLVSSAHVRERAYVQLLKDKDQKIADLGAILEEMLDLELAPVDNSGDPEKG